MVSKITLCVYFEQQFLENPAKKRDTVTVMLHMILVTPHTPAGYYGALLRLQLNVHIHHAKPIYSSE